MGLEDLSEFIDDNGGGDDETVEEETGGKESTQLATTRLTISGIFNEVTEEEAEELIIEFANEYIEEFNAEMDNYHMSNLHTEARVRDVDDSYAPEWYSEDG